MTSHRCAVYYPGNLHDSKLSSACKIIFPRLSDEKSPPGFEILGECAFFISLRMTPGNIVRLRNSNETEGILRYALLSAVDIVLQRVIPSERQSAEWVIRALKVPFGRLRLPINPRIAQTVPATLYLRVLDAIFPWNCWYEPNQYILRGAAKRGAVLGQPAAVEQNYEQY